MPPPSPHDHDVKVASRRRTARRRLILIAIIVIVLAGGAWYFEKSLSLPLQNLAAFGNSLESSVTQQFGQNFSAPTSTVEQNVKTAPKKANALDATGVIAETNAARAANGGLPPLAEDATLDDIATLRLDDLFAQQYFAHVGPQGESAITVASSVGYASIALGENLALGTYAGDAGVVAAWMASPGHRANILDTHYTQIGVAVREGEYDGAETWIAVQVFGRPASACPSPDANLKTSIDLSESQLSTMSSELQSEKASIDAMSPPSGPAYNAQVEDYNNLVAQYNNLAAGTKNAITEYDAEVDTFNACLAD